MDCLRLARCPSRKERVFEKHQSIAPSRKSLYKEGVTRGWRSSRRSTHGFNLAPLAYLSSEKEPDGRQVLRLLLLQSDFESDAALLNVRVLELGLGHKLLKLTIHLRLLRVLARDFEKGLADIKPGNLTA